MNAETEMASADGLGAAPPNYAERLRRLRELIDDESPSDGIHNPEVAELFDAAGEECICAEQDTPGHAAGCPLGELPECPQFLACTSEGSGESSYRDNPDFFAGTAEEVGEWAAGSFNEGWALNWIVDLESGKGAHWKVSVAVEEV